MIFKRFLDMTDTEIKENERLWLEKNKLSTLDELFARIAELGTIVVYQDDRNKEFTVTISKVTPNAKLEAKSGIHKTLNSALISAIISAEQLIGNKNDR